MHHEFIKDKTLLITGGTGSFGSYMLKKVAKLGLKKIKIFSRDEKKQHDMRTNLKMDNLEFIIGDVRDTQSIMSACNDTDIIFHAAALKQVPSCEFFPMEAISTNVIGTSNLLEAAIQNKVKSVVCLSTDKAVHPVNAMGMTKALMEKIALAKARSSKDTTITITRYGNVISSRGSVIPLFLDQIKQKIPISITDPSMTRFIMSLEEAIDLVLHALNHGEKGSIYVKKSPACNVGQIAKVLKFLMNREKHKELIIGPRHGEKFHEVLISQEELSRSIEKDGFYEILPDSRDLEYCKYEHIGDKDINKYTEYNSKNTTQLSDNELAEKLKNYVMG